MALYELRYFFDPGSGTEVMMNDPKFFAKVRAVQDGRALAWPGELEFCTDALFLEASDARGNKAKAPSQEARLVYIEPFSEGRPFRVVPERGGKHQ